MANTGRNLARLQVIAAALLFSSGGAGIKVESFTAAQVSMLRSGIATIALLLWLRRAPGWTPGAVSAGVVYAATLSLFVAATKLTTAASAIFLQSTAPLYLLVLAPLVLHERVRRHDIVYVGGVAAGIVLCFAGTPVAAATAPDPAAGNLLGAAAGLAWALTLVSLRKIGRDDARGGTTITAVVAGNAIACLTAVPFAFPLPAAPLAEWFTLAYLGLFQIALAYVCLTAAIRRLPALEISLLLLLEPVLNPVWTWLIRGEQPGGWTIIGGIVIIAATAAKVFYDSVTTSAQGCSQGR
jgi:drug/metabolite transporter, DME family